MKIRKLNNLYKGWQGYLLLNYNISIAELVQYKWRRLLENPRGAVILS